MSTLLGFGLPTSRYAKMTPVSDTAKYKQILSVRDDEHERATIRIERKCAKKMLAYYRKLLRKHNTKNHVIACWEGMGACGVTINGQMLGNFPAPRSMGILQLLSDIEESMDSSWAYLLGGEVLNPKEDIVI